jgi:XTP/dITP diphosphohydrolase
MNPAMRILLASTNHHKVGEIRAVIDIASPGLIELVGLDDLDEAGGGIAEPVEDQSTFEGNAVLKARHYARAAGMLCLADDSGLEVDALAGEPGVRSARYSGIAGPRAVVDPANNRLLLERLADVPPQERTARFVCAMALCHPDRLAPAALVRGTIEGRIITPDEAADAAHPERGRGDNGFGYDPLFFVDDRGCTTAELSPSEKNAISHRGRATRLMLACLERLRTKRVAQA